MNSFAFSTSIPPGVNNLYATVTIKGKPRRIISRTYKAWRELEARLVGEQWRKAGSPIFQRHLSLTIHLGLNYQSDIDGRCKAICDLLPHAIPGFVDDRYIDRIIIERVKGIDNARVLILQSSPLGEG